MENCTVDKMYYLFVLKPNPNLSPSYCISYNGFKKVYISFYPIYLVDIKVYIV